MIWKDQPVEKEIEEIKSKIGTVPSGKTVEGQITELNSNIATKVKGNNGTGNDSIEVRNNNATGLIILNASNPSVNTPSIWMEINASANQLYFYKDVGSGWVTLGHLDITP